MKTKVFLDEFKGQKVFAVWEVNDNGDKIGDYPQFSVGARKAVAVSNHLEEFKEYIATSRVELERKGKR